MRNPTRTCPVGRRLIVWLALAGALLAAPAAAAEPDPGATAETDPSVLTPEEHWAKGEARYQGQWMPISKLFQRYLEARNRLRAVKKHGDSEQERLQKLHYEMAGIRSEKREEAMPIRRELYKARNQLRHYDRILNRRPPQKPELQRMPSPPRRMRTSSRSNYGSSSYRSGHDSSYERARRQWRQQCEVIKRQNEAKMQRYKQQLEEYHRLREEAKEEVPKLQATAKECMKKLDELGEEYDEKLAPTRQRSDRMTDRVRAQMRRVEAAETAVEEIGKALMGVPEEIRLKHGIAAFEKEFHTLPELRQVYKETQADVERVRSKLQAECEKAGFPFPENWKHPQQQRMEAIKALLDKAARIKAEAK